MLRRALVRAGPRLVEAIRRARTDRVADLDALAAWAAAYGHDLLVFHRADLTVARHAGGDSPDLERFEQAMHAEHDELATSARDADRALHHWALQAGDGRAALSAARVQLDDLVVHEAHEASTLDQVAGAVGPSDLQSALHEALLQAPLHEPPFLGPLTLADLGPTDRRTLLEALPTALAERWAVAEGDHAELTRRAMGA